MSECKVGEIFRHSGDTFQHLVNRIDVVTKPKEGMLFRASDGVLYELRKREASGCFCNIDRIYSCPDITKEAFGKMISPDLHWYPVEEKKEEIMENQKRHLELAVVKVEGDQVTFRIAEQTHRGKYFTQNGEKFKSSCGYFLIVDTDPGFRDDYTGKILFVRGYDSAEDDNKITVPLHNFAKIMQAVTEYNDTNGKGYEKPWPQEGDKYFCFNSAGQVHDYTYDKLKIDEPRREFGNFFRTIEEAEAAIDRVKKALKGES